MRKMLESLSRKVRGWHRPRAGKPARPPGRRPRLECLEDRTLPSASFGFAQEVAFKGNAGSGNAIAADAAGDVYVAGTFSGSAILGSVSLSAQGPYDFFLAKYSAAGNLLWARDIGGAQSYTFANALAVDSSGNVYVTGSFNQTAHFDPTSSAGDRTSPGANEDLFVAKYDSNGQYVWADSAVLDQRVSSATVGNAIAIDSHGVIYIAGGASGLASFPTTSFPPSTGIPRVASAGGWDALVAKVNSDGNFYWARTFGGTGGDMGTGVAVDPAGNVVYFSGDFSGTADFYPRSSSVPSLTAVGRQDAFVAALDGTGNPYWSHDLPGPFGSSGLLGIGGGVAVDSTGHVITTAAFESSSGANDLLVAGFTTAGAPLWQHDVSGAWLGGQVRGGGSTIAVDGNGHFFITGSFQGMANFSPGFGALTDAGPNAAAFVAQVNANGTFVWAGAFQGSTSSDFAFGLAIAVDGQGHIDTTGTFGGTVDFDPGAGVHNLQVGRGAAGVYVSQLQLVNNGSPYEAPALNYLTAGANYAYYNYVNGSHSIYAYYAYVYGYYAEVYAQLAAATHSATDWYYAYQFGAAASNYAYADYATSGSVYALYTFVYDYYGYTYANLAYGSV
jgi:hypothetical protein